MRRLFVNADDFGLTEGVSLGIEAACRDGVVRGTTAMMAVPGADGIVRRLAPGFPGAIGLHLQLTGGVPCLPPGEVPSLVTAEGTFPRKKIGVADVDPEQVRREWQAQLARFRSLGLAPTHLDSHHHIHKRPEVFPVFLTLARELGIPARALSGAMRREMAAAGVACADACVTGWFGENLTAEAFVSLVEAAFAEIGGQGAVEVMAHPGRCDQALREISGYAEGREEELRVLTLPELGRALARRDIELVGPAGLAA